MRKRDITFLAVIIILMITAHHIFENIYTGLKTNEIILDSETATIDLSDWDGALSTYRGPVNFYNNVTMASYTEGITPSVTMNLPISWWNSTAYSNHSPDGYGLYEWTFTGLDPDRAYGLKFNDVETAYNVYVNEAEVLSVGSFATDAARHQGNMGAAFVAFTASPEGVAHVFVEVSNYSLNVGGIWNTVQVGLYDNILKQSLRMFFIEIILSAGTLTIMLLAIGFIIRDPRREALPLLALLSLLSTVNSIFSGSRLGYYLFPDISFAFELRLEYLTGYLLFPVFVMLVNVFVSPKDKKIINRILGGVSALLAFICLFLPQNIYLEIWHIYMPLIFLLSIILLIVMVKAFQREIPAKRTMTVAIALCIMAIDVQYHFADAFSLVGIVSFAVILLFSWLTIRQYADDTRENERLQEKICVDELTGLNNRECFLKELQRLKKQLKKAEAENNHYIMFLDLDGLKAVNDQFSHLAGDQVIIESSRRIRLSLRSGDLIARYGGDEFLVLLEGVKRSKVEEIAERIIRHISEPMLTTEGSFELGVSIGIYRIDLSEDIQSWIGKSDQAMYASKQNGRNRYTFISDMS